MLSMSLVPSLYERRRLWSTGVLFAVAEVVVVVKEDHSLLVRSVEVLLKAEVLSRAFNRSSTGI